MIRANTFRWTNKSVLALAGSEDPISVIERKARESCATGFATRDGRALPFNPIFIADLLNIPVTAKPPVLLMLVSLHRTANFKFNSIRPQIRERVRFSIAHELAHSLFPDAADEIRHRGGNRVVKDDWPT